MSLFILVMVAGAIFLIVDAVMPSTGIRPICAQHLGETLREVIRPLPAALCYVTYMSGVVWFADWPALGDGTPAKPLLNGAILR